jgi:actin-related protein
MYVANQAVLSFHTNGRLDGVILESGDGVTSAIPIYQGEYSPSFLFLCTNY